MVHLGWQMGSTHLFSMAHQGQEASDQGSASSPVRSGLQSEILDLGGQKLPFRNSGHMHVSMASANGWFSGS